MVLDFLLEVGMLNIEMGMMCMLNIEWVSEGCRKSCVPHDMGPMSEHARQMPVKNTIPPNLRLDVSLQIRLPTEFVDVGFLAKNSPVILALWNLSI